ncbi:hypothetical protein [Leadbetterella sp. DM7]|uniref:hypothetical protein n=1 Tax=Leadbetterella sp. DM7 TaxID=3235085 RepID=UPI00349EA314
MKEVLKKMLWVQLNHSYPELLLQLHQSGRLTAYLDERTEEIMEQLALENTQVNYAAVVESVKASTARLGRSAYRYVYLTLKEDFPREFEEMCTSGLLAYHVMNMLGACQEVMNTLAFGKENEDERAIRYAVIERVHNYLSGADGWQHL